MFEPAWGLHYIYIYLCMYVCICICIYIYWSATPLATFYPKTELPPYTPTLSNKNIKNSPERGEECSFEAYGQYL